MIKTLIKFSIAAALIGWLVKSGKIDFSLLSKSFEHVENWIICFSFLLLNILIGAFRWKRILQLKSNKVFPYLKILMINWIGLLFNTILPGSVSGDFIKLVYAKGLDENFTKTFLITSVLMDRIIGLFGLLSLMGIASIINYSELVALSPQVEKLIHFNFFVFAAILAILFSILLPGRIQTKILAISSKLPVIAKHLTNTLEQIWLIGRHRRIFFENVLLSMFGQTFFMLGFWILASPFFNVEIEFKYALTFIPLGLTTIAIPITPQGLGIGHAVFEKLFSFFGVTGGASLFNLYFVSNVVSCLLGVFPYLMWGNRKKIKQQLSEFE